MLKRALHREVLDVKLVLTSYGIGLLAWGSQCDTSHYQWVRRHCTDDKVYFYYSHAHNLIVGLYTISHPILSESPFQYQECRLDRSLGVGSDPITGDLPTLPDHNLWASTYTTDRRSPQMARLEDPTGVFKYRKTIGGIQTNTYILLSNSDI